MKIALSGASGVGKTTIAKKIHKKSGVTFLSSIVRDIAKQNNIKPLNITKGVTFLKFQQQILNEKISQELRHSNFITDRCVMDSIAYTYLNHHLLTDDMNETIIRYELTAAEHCKNNYDIIYKLPIGAFELECDEFRNISNISNRCVDMILDSLYKKHDINIVYLNHDNAFDLISESV